MTNVELEPTIFTNEEFEARLEREIAKSIEVRRPYTVLAFLPRILQLDDPSEVIAAGSAAVRKLMRVDDLAGRLDGLVFVVGLRDTDAGGARIFGHRLQSDLSLRSARLRGAIWEAGMATLPDDGFTAEELLGAAIQSARTRRRRLGML